ncbi:hypothetical protein, partial [Planktothricoides raciborskii]
RSSDLETGFLLWVSGVICGMRRRNPVSGGFGVDGGGIETGFLLWVSGVICGMQKRNPVSGVPKIK